ncbi:MFS transporter, partial [Pseudomonadales bacterium]|nr:MFS transporter [Pseudomonadales bacterium]
AFISIQVTFYILIAFVIAYGTNEEGLGLPRSTMLSAVLIASVIQVIVQFYAASWSDRHGRRGVYLAGAGLLALWSFALFPLIDTGNFFFIIVGIAGGLSFLAMQYGPQAAFYTELFTTQVRYSGASLGYQIGAILGGAFAPSIAVLLWKELGIIYVSVYITLACFITIGSVLMLTETSGTDIHS